MTLTGFPHPCTSQLLYNCHDFSWFPSSVCSHISEVVRSMFNYKTSSLQTNNWILRDHFKMVFFRIMEKKLKKKKIDLQYVFLPALIFLELDPCTVTSPKTCPQVWPGSLKMLASIWLQTSPCHFGECIRVVYNFFLNIVRLFFYLE